MFSASLVLCGLILLCMKKKNHQFLQCKMRHEILISRLYNLAVKELFRIICRFVRTPMHDTDQKHQPSSSVMWSFTNKCWIILSIRFSSFQNTSHLTSRLNRNSSVNRICLQQHCFQTRCQLSTFFGPHCCLRSTEYRFLAHLHRDHLDEAYFELFGSKTFVASVRPRGNCVCNWVALLFTSRRIVNRIYWSFAVTHGRHWPFQCLPFYVSWN